MNEIQPTLIADVGSTKADIAVVYGDGSKVVQFTIDGLNALIADEDTINRFLHAISVNLPSSIVPEIVHFYGAGCSTREVCEKLSHKFSQHFHGCEAFVESDLLGAARSVLENEAGIACILGTGSNSCLYDGERIVDHVPSLGFILGDEGSGTALGKILLGDYFKRQLPLTLHQAFKEEYGLTVAETLDRVYREPSPNKFISSFVPFIKRHEDSPYINNLLTSEFRCFFMRNVDKYENSHSYPLSFIGGIAANFNSCIKKVAAESGYRVGMILSRPLEGLINFHLKNNKK